MLTNLLDLKKSNVLITGGSEGIGRGLAERFLKAGSTVLVTGRNPEKLKRAASELPGLRTLVNDISKPEGRVELAEYIAETFPKLNVLFNNAGIQRRIALAADTAPWQERQVEIDTLLSGPVHLNSLLIPHMLRNDLPSRIVNVTSGGAFIPQVFAPIYGACKAALHSYTVTLRHALAGTSIGVVELIPPAVQTALAGPSTTHGAPLDAFCDQVFSAFQSESEMIGFGPTDAPQFKKLVETVEPMFQTSAGRFPVAIYTSAKDKK
jgi:uncharacterized oxidoreductase